MSVDEVYAEASRLLAVPEDDLRRKATAVFASMLYHAVQSDGRCCWTYARVVRHGASARMEVEVNAPPRANRKA